MIINFFFSEFEQKYSDFSPKSFGRFPKKRSTCPEEQSVKSVESKRNMKPKFFGELFDKSQTFGGKLAADLSKLHSTCRANFWGKSIFSSMNLIGNFFGHWTHIVKGLAELSPQVSKNCFLHVRRRNACVVQLFRRMFCFWKFL